MAKSTLDKDLKKVGQLEMATASVARSVAPSGLAAAFLCIVLAVIASTVAEGPLAIFVVMAAVVGGYMALNIGANDVANNMGPAVGSHALTLAGALAIAAICEVAGALLAGGDVVTTVSRDIIRPDATPGTEEFILVMMASLLAAAMWIHLATYFGAPVSTTHSVVGGVLGAGVAAAGFAVVSWPTVGTIAASWVISPLLGGIGAALLLALIRWTILRRPDRIAAARTWVPIFVALMAGVFAMYLASKGLSRVWRPGTAIVLVLGAGAFLLTWLAARPWVVRRSHPEHDRRKDINRMFVLPLIVSAALLSFAHGANDVANAVGPLAAIVAAAQAGSTELTNVAIPLWVMTIGAVGIAIGLALFGPKVIRTVGERITKLDPLRAYCVALSAAGTVLVASALGLPVSSTHIAVGGVFGVGLIRERWRNRGIPSRAVQPRTHFLKVSALNTTPDEAVTRYQKRERRRLVRRQHLLGIAAAWVITVPATASGAALLYLVLAYATGL
ncbi:MAG: inorganic phosphate transporter [Alphaproteobacteria bacterium]